jgi:hypothetical protein
MPFPLARFQRVGASAAFISEMQAAWANLDPLIQTGLALAISEVSDGTLVAVLAGQASTAGPSAAIGQIIQLVSVTTTSVPAVSGLYLPSGWGQFWIAKRNAAAAGKAVIAAVGDSITAGYYSSDPYHLGWVGRLRSSLQAQYGDGGSGFRKAIESQPAYVDLSFPTAAINAYVASGVAFVTTGTWAVGITAAGYAGPAGRFLTSTTSGSTITFTVRGTTVSVYFATASGFASSIPWTIDGVAQTPINQNEAAGTYKISVTGLALGNHTVKFTVPSGGASVNISGVSGENATGVVVNDFAIPGLGTSSSYSNNDVYGGVGLWSGGSSYPADLVIYGAFGDDVLSDAGGDVWETNARRYLSGVKEGTNGQSDILIVAPHIGQFDTSFVYQEYVDRARGLAETFGAAFYDMWRVGRNSWSYWQSLGYFAIEDGSGNSGSSEGHLSDAGSAYVASLLLPIVNAAQPSS